MELPAIEPFSLGLSESFHAPASGLPPTWCQPSSCCWLVLLGLLVFGPLRTLFKVSFLTVFPNHGATYQGGHVPLIEVLVPLPHPVALLALL